MFKSVKFWLATGGLGAAVGLCVVGWLQWNLDQSRTTVNDNSKTSSLSQVDPSNTGASGNVLPVITDGGQGFANSSTQDQQGQNVTSSSGSGSSTSGLPGPSDFGQYNSYKDSPTALFIDSVVGTGQAIQDGSVATVQYTGYLTNGTEFDSTYTRNQALQFTEGAGKVIPGWEEAIFGMKVGGQRRLIVPPGLAFGSTAHDSIPANSVLIFDVTLISVK